jgi:hypothetical protein
VVTNISREPAAFIEGVDDQDSGILRNDGKYIQVYIEYIVNCPTGLKSSNLMDTGISSEYSV